MPNKLIIRLKLVPYVDVAGVKSLKNLIQECSANQTKIIFSGIQAQPASLFEKAGIISDQKTIWFKNSYSSAIDLAKELVNPNK